MEEKDGENESARDQATSTRIAELEAELASMRQTNFLLAATVKKCGLNPQAVALKGTPSTSYVSRADETSQLMQMVATSSSTTKLIEGEIELRDAPLQKFADILGTSRGVTVKLKELSYTVTRKAVDARETVGGKAKMMASLLLCAPCRAKSSTRTILKDITTVFVPGEITLLTGPAGCGKSLLLKAIAGRLSLNKTHHVSGSITYNGDEPKGHFSLPKVATYIDQRDCHIAELTVEQTFDFAFKCTAMGSHAFSVPAPLTLDQQKLIDRMDTANGMVQFVMRKLGLFNARNTVIGNEVLRGVSGGERRRVTAGEMMCTPCEVMMFDSISTGLDSSTTFDIITTLKEIAKTFKKTVVIALLQPPPEVFELFQNVCVMAEGSIIYQGKREGMLPYFENMGYFCPPRKDVADYIVEVPTEVGDVYLQQGSGTARHHKTPRQFVEAWKASPEFASMVEEVHQQEEKASWKPSQVHKFAGTWMYHTSLCFKQQFLLLKQDKKFIKTRLGTVLLMGVVIGSVFLSIPFEEYQTKLGVLYFSLMFLSLSSTTQVVAVFARRQIMYKHMGAGFYGAFNDAAGNILTSLPMQLVEVALFSPLVYFLSGLDDSIARFFTFVIVQFCVYLNYGQLMRFLAAVLPDRVRAQGVAALVILMTILYSGYILPSDTIPSYWMWVYKCNPLAWAFSAVVINEFTSPKYDVCAPGLPEFEGCPTYGATVLDAFGFKDDTTQIWIGVIIILVEWAVMACITALTFRFFVWEISDNAPVSTSDEDLEMERIDAVMSGMGASALGGMTSTNAKVTDEEEQIGLKSVNSFQGVSASVSKRSSGESETLPFTPVTLAFRDIWYSVPHPGGEGELDLLKGVTGFAQPGTMTALMGSSGAGKTTLMDVLAGRKTGGTIKGDILLNGYPKVQDTYTRIAGYCEQMDIHSPVVTVKEALAFSAAMRLDSQITREQREAYVNSVLDLLELANIEEEVIGSLEGGGLSIEQRKRVTIGVELCANPSLIFADEPTSGLDSRSAQVVMRCISAVAQSGRTVICTIHQPSTAIFEMFQYLLLLKKGGETVYFGELGVNSSILIKFLEAIPGTHPYRDGVNPATWMLSCIGAGTSAVVDPQVYADYYKVSELSVCNAEETNKQCEVKPGVEELVFERKYAATLHTQYSECIHRAFCQYWRSPSYSFSKILLNTLVAIIMGSNFYGVPYDTESNMFGRLAIFYSSSAFLGILYYSMPIPFIDSERVVFYREQASNMYYPSAFALGFGIAELPYNLLSSTAFCSIFYFFAEFTPDATKFFAYWLGFTLYVMFQSYFGAFLVNACPTTAIAQEIGTICNSMFNIFAGFMISPGNISNFWKVFYYLDPLRYCLAASVSSQYHNDDTVITLANGLTTTAAEFTYETFDGDMVWGDYWLYIGALFGFVAAVRFANLYALMYLRYIKR